MLTTEQLDNWFTYHAPTEETAPKYAEIRKAESEAGQVMVAILNNGDLVAFQAINQAARTMVEVIDRCCPDSADKSAAIRCVRLARNAMNEALVVRGDPFNPSSECIRLVKMAADDLTRARWQANSAIACGGK